MNETSHSPTFQTVVPFIDGTQNQTCCQCGTLVGGKDAQFCTNCGASLLRTARVKRISFNLHVRRLVAFFVDSVLLTIAAYVPLEISEALSWPLNLVVVLLTVGAMLFYFCYFETSELQATVGKRLVGLKVVDERGRRIGWAKAVSRTFVVLGLQFVLVGASYFMQIPAAEKLGLVLLFLFLGSSFLVPQDFSSKTYVVQSR